MSSFVFFDKILISVISLLSSKEIFSGTFPTLLNTISHFLKLPPEFFGCLLAESFPVILSPSIINFPFTVYFLSFLTPLNFNLPFFSILTYAVLFPAIASYLFWIKGISIIGTNRAGVFLHLMPIFGAILAMIIFKEKFMFYHILGAIFIIIGITLSNKKKLNA